MGEPFNLTVNKLIECCCVDGWAVGFPSETQDEPLATRERTQAAGVQVLQFCPGSVSLFTHWSWRLAKPTSHAQRQCPLTTLFSPPKGDGVWLSEGAARRTVEGWSQGRGLWFTLLGLP